jgi:hypothetical protein
VRTGHHEIGHNAIRMACMGSAFWQAFLKAPELSIEWEFIG